jgi:hypothetical protein
LYSFSLDAMRILKQKWKVPIGVMIKRIEDLKLVGKDQAKRLWIGKARRRWKDSSEPLDEELQVEQPRLLSESVTLLVDEQILSKSEILRDLPFSDRDVELLIGMPQGYLTDTMPVISILPPKQRRLELSTGVSAPVVSFPRQSEPADTKRRKTTRA